MQVLGERISISIARTKNLTRTKNASGRKMHPGQDFVFNNLIICKAHRNNEDLQLELFEAPYILLIAPF